MTAMPKTVDMETPLVDANKILQEHGIRHLPVLDHGKLVGVVSQREIALLQACGAVDLNRVSIADAMTAAPYAVSPDTPLSEVCTTMASNKYGSVVITEADSILGIFTTTDALQVLSELFRAL